MQPNKKIATNSTVNEFVFVIPRKQILDIDEVKSMHR